MSKANIAHEKQRRKYLCVPEVGAKVIAGLPELKSDHLMHCDKDQLAPSLAQ